MFTNLTHHPHLTQAQHRALPAVSNTDLSALAAELLGQPRRACAAAFAFGAYFHSALLEPAHFQALGAALPLGPGEQQYLAAGQLARAIRRHRYPRHVIYRGQPEQSYTATHAATGLTVKVRPDLLIDSPQQRRRTLVDFKTTSCRDQAQFVATVDQYAYDRQGAFYADVLGAHRVVLIAVQKRPLKGQAPQVWVVELTPEQLTLGRKKYQKLLRCYIQRPATR